MKSHTPQAVLNSLDQAELVVPAMRTQRPEVSALLTAYLRAQFPEEEGTPAIDWDLLQELHAKLLEKATREMRQVDEAHRINQVRAFDLRQRRKEVVRRLKARHRDLRQMFAGAYGVDALPLAGLDTPPRDRFLAVRERVLDVLTRLRAPDLTSRLPAPRPGSHLNLGELADAMEADVHAFEELTATLNELLQQLEGSLVKKQAELKRHRRVYQSLTRIQEGYYRLVGLDELARRIRVNIRRRRAETGPEIPAPDTPLPPQPDVPLPVPPAAGPPA